MRKWLLSIALVAAGAGCLVQDVNLEGKACSTNHPCAEGYQCVAGTCLLPDHVPATDAGTADAGGGDAGYDAGIPPNVGTLTGPLAFTASYLVDDSVAVSGSGSDVTLVMAAVPITCSDYLSTPGEVIELDAVDHVTPFPPGTYQLQLADGGPSQHPVVHLQYVRPFADGGASTFDSAVAAGSHGVTGQVTFAVFDPHYISGSFDLRMHYEDAGDSQLLGSFTANDTGSGCAP